MHFFGKTVLLEDSLELVREGVVEFEDKGDKGSSVDTNNAFSNASLTS